MKDLEKEVAKDLASAEADKELSKPKQPSSPTKVE